MKLNRFLYKTSRSINKVAGAITDIEILLSFNPKKITNRFVRKKINKTGNKIIRNINKKFR